ncbi:MAG: VOC family protein [Hyphomonadaceae bacterium]
MLAAARLQAMTATAAPDAARAFYRDILGLPLLSEDMFALIFEVGGAPLRVAKTPGVAPSPYAVLGFTVDAIEPVARGLAAKGVTFERYAFLQHDAHGIWTAPDGARVAWFRDPDGNLLSLAQEAP